MYDLAQQKIDDLTLICQKKSAQEARSSTTHDHTKRIPTLYSAPAPHLIDQSRYPPKAPYNSNTDIMNNAADNYIEYNMDSVWNM